MNYVETKAFAGSEEELNFRIKELTKRGFEVVRTFNFLRRGSEFAGNIHACGAVLRKYEDKGEI